MADYDLQYQDTYIDALLATANELKTAGYIFKGVATPSTNPGTPTERVAYLASEPGTYTNFGGIVIASGLYSLTYAGGTWTGTQMQAGSDIEVVQTTGQSASDVMSQKAVTEEINNLSSAAQIYKSEDGILVTGYCILSKTHNWSGNYNTHSYYYWMVKPGDTFIIQAQQSNPAYYTWLINRATAPTITPNYASGYSIMTLDSGQSVKINAPADANILYITNTMTSVNYFPTSVVKVDPDNLKNNLTKLFYACEKLIDSLTHVAWAETGGQNIINSIKQSIYGGLTAVSMSVKYNQRQIIFDQGISSYDDIAMDLIVYLDYGNGNLVPTVDYTITGTFTAGTQTFTITCDGFTASISVVVTAYGSITLYENIESVAGAPDNYTISNKYYQSINDYLTSSGRKIFGLPYGIKTYRNNNKVALSPTLYPFKVPSTCSSIKASISPSSTYLSVKLIFIDGDNYLVNPSGTNTAILTNYQQGQATLNISSYTGRSDMYCLVYSKYDSGGKAYIGITDLKIEFL